MLGKRQPTLSINLPPAIAGISDFFSMSSSAYFAHWLRFEDVKLTESYDLFVLIGALLFVITCAATNLYKGVTRTNEFTLVIQLAIALAVSFSALFTYLVFTKTSAEFSRLWLGIWIMAGFIFLLVARLILSQVRRSYLQRNKRGILLVGELEIAKKIQADAEIVETLGYEIVDFIDSAAYSDTELGQLATKASSYDLEEIWICLPLSEEAYVDSLIYELRHSTYDIRQILRTPDLNLLAKQVSYFGGISTLDISCSPHYGGQFVLKAMEDYILGFVLFVGSLPLMLAIAIGVRLSSPGPILFKQQRTGVDGKKFKVYKFRTMAIHQESTGEVTQAKKNDPRVTRFGRFLRSYSLDELPQFFNVLQGRMSIVGPRPHALAHNEYYKDLIDSYMRRHMVKPGITGWAQVNGYRGEAQTVDRMKVRVEHDVYYIENWNIWLDLKIILLTPFALFVQRKSAY